MPGLARIRENAVLLEYLKENRTKEMKVDELLSVLPQDTEQENIWQANLRAILKEWAWETVDNPQPVPAEEYLYEVLGEHLTRTAVLTGL